MVNSYTYQCFSVVTVCSLKTNEMALKNYFTVKSPTKKFIEINKLEHKLSMFFGIIILLNNYCDLNNIIILYLQ